MMRLRKTVSVGVLAGTATSLAIGIGVASVEAAPAYRDTIVAQNPLAYWRFNDGHLEHGEAIAAEVGGSISSAKNAGGVTEGVAGPALPGLGADNTAFSYDGSTNAITYDLTSTSNVGSGMSSDAGSVSYWFKRNEADGGGTSVLYFGTNRTDLVDGFSNDTLHTWMTVGGRTGFYLDGIQTQTETSAPYRYLYSDDQWHHAAITWDRATGIINYFLDGGEGGHSDSGQTFTTVVPNDALWDSFELTKDRFGKAAYSTSRFFPGQADELAVWNRPLSEAEVLAQYSAALVPEPASVGLLGLAGIGLLARRRRV